MTPETLCSGLVHFTRINDGLVPGAGIVVQRCELVNDDGSLALETPEAMEVLNYFIDLTKIKRSTPLLHRLKVWVDR
ncbi:hypothetical protein [Paenibacillus sp. E222]|uniref:hypothetical protein n=1 Tax=Paenibacillus sp. E222 TaxID=2748863 RepID=UPI00211C943B|nr:hypothetical protein [Paenibacillus sp. E222]